MAFCLYVAARVFVQYLKKEPNDQETRTALEFLFTAMTALKRKNPLTESFMIQLKLDIEGSGIDPLLHNPDLSSIVKDRIVRTIHGVTDGTFTDWHAAIRSCRPALCL